MPVIDNEGKVIEMVTEYAILAQIQNGGELIKITTRGSMVKSVITADGNSPIEEIIKIMLDKDIIRPPVTEKGKLVSVIAR